MTMTENERIVAEKRAVDIARQHQEMNKKYTGYQASIQWIRDKIAVLDSQWHIQSIDNDMLQQLRGQRQVLDDVLRHFEDQLSMDISAKLKHIETMEIGE